jgi:hypothetical protein
LIYAHILPTREKHLTQANSSASKTSDASALGTACGYCSNYCSGCAGLGNGACVFALLAVGSYCAFFISNGAVARAGRIFQCSGEINGVAVGKNHGGEVKQNFCPPFDPSGTLDLGNLTLHICSSWDHSHIVLGHGKTCPAINSIANLGALGIDGALQVKQYLRAGGNGYLIDARIIAGNCGSFVCTAAPGEETSCAEAFCVETVCAEAASIEARKKTTPRM